MHFSLCRSASCTDVGAPVAPRKPRRHSKYRRLEVEARRQSALCSHLASGIWGVRRAAYFHRFAAFGREASLVLPNTSLKLTHYGRRRLAAPGVCGILPSAAKRRPPTRAA